MKGLTFLVVPSTVVFLGACGGLEAGRPSKAAGRNADLLGDPLALTEVTVDDGDGDPIVANVDAETLDAVEDSVQAMLRDPAGLSCTVGTRPAFGGDDDDKHDKTFAVGAGRYLSFAAAPQGCVLSFGLKAHNKFDAMNPTSTTSARGKVTWRSAPGPSQPDPSCSDGQVKIEVTCMAAVATAQNAMPAAAQIKGFVREATGMFADIAPGSPFCLVNGVNGVCVVLTDATDGKKTGNADTINQYVDFTRTPYTCVPPTSPQNPLISGNITIKAN